MSNKKILIVDDDQDLTRGLKIRLQANGYETVFAGDGCSAVKIAKEEKPDLVLLDLGLPAGDGFIVMERLKSLSSLSTIPIIVLSARDPKGNMERAFQAGANAFFQKPADNEELLETIQRFLKKGF